MIRKVALVILLWTSANQVYVFCIGGLVVPHTSLCRDFPLFCLLVLLLLFLLPVCLRCSALAIRTTSAHARK